MTDDTRAHDAELPQELTTLVSALRAHPDTVASEALLSRIHRSRAEGVRVLLPTADTPLFVHAPRAKWRLPVALVGVCGVAATVVLLVGQGSMPRPATPSANNTAGAPVDTPPPPSPPSPSGELARLFTPWPAMAYAQRPDVRREGAYPPIANIDTRRLAAGRRTYVRLSSNAYHDLVPHQTYSIRLDSVRLKQQWVWRVITELSPITSLRTPASFAKPLVDTLWLGYDSLRPVRRHFQAGVLKVRQTFSDSGLTETDSLDVERLGAAAAKLRMPFRRGTTKALDPSRMLVPNEAAMRVLLRALPLATGWRGSISVFSGNSREFALGSPEYLNLRVAGVDTVQTFSGRFASWRVVLDTGGNPEIWYVSQETGETILTEGAHGLTYPRSLSYLMSGFEETKRLPPVRRNLPPSGPP